MSPVPFSPVKFDCLQHYAGLRILMEKLAFRNFNVKHLRVNVKMSRELNIRTGIWRHLARVFSGLSLDPQISQNARFNIRFNIRAQRSKKWHFRNRENKLIAQLELQIGFARESAPKFVGFFYLQQLFRKEISANNLDRRSFDFPSFHFQLLARRASGP
jgi:hypothetical protein